MKHFTLQELTSSSKAKRLGIDNTPTPEAKARLVALVAHTLDPLREAIGVPIKVTSGYRSPKLNNRISGASATSQHQRGEAVDFQCADMAKAFAYIRANLPFDQLIWEEGDDRQPRWIHVSYRMGANRKQVLRKYANDKRYYKIK